MRFIKFLVKLIPVFLIISALMAAYALLIEPKLLTTVNYNYNTNKIKINIKVAFFTDTHFGKFTSIDKITDVVEKINAESPDIVVFGGDLLDNYKRDKKILDIGFLTAELSRLNAEYKFAVWGNHDYGGSAAQTVKSIWQNAGFKLMANESFIIDALGVELMMINDLYRELPKTEVLTPKTSYLPITFCHQPDIAGRILGDALPLMFSGHTHGGQILLPFLTEAALPTLGKNYRYGAYDVNSGRLIVSCGVGVTGIPARFLNVPEIVILNIKPEV